MLIDSEASYIMLDGVLQREKRYAEALKAHEGDSITVRLATMTRVTVPNSA